MRARAREQRVKGGHCRNAAIAIAIHRTLNPHNTNIVKTYVFKLMNSSEVLESGESEKVLLLMESGVRLHTTVYMRDKSNTPFGFTLKLRKHIQTRRLEDVRQLGYDRIILFQFRLGENANYVILELYAQGNILLTDANFTVLILLRSHRLILVLVPNIKSFLPLDMYMVGVCDKRRICQDLRKQIRIAVEDKDTMIVLKHFKNT
ncbi:hypothetical protein S245_052276, partial [Arachis hypogaea]